MADAEDSNSGSGLGSHHDSLQLLTKTRLDKAVSTNDIMLDLQRALTYEAVFSTLVEHKMQALKRDYEEHKRAKRKKRKKSIGRILLPRKLFGTRRSSSREEEEEEFAGAERQPVQVQQAKTAPLPSTSQRPVQAEAAQLEDSVASTLSNSSGRQGGGRHSMLVVQAQTHTPAQPATQCSSSSSSAEELQGGGAAAAAAATPASTTRLPQHSSMRSTTTATTTPTLASCYDNTSLGTAATGTASATLVRGAGLHSSTMADDSLTASLRGSLESLSYSSSRCTVSFGGAEIIAVAHGDADTRERARLAKRLRILEAKSISAQCSPIFPRSLVRSIPLPVPQQAVSLGHIALSLHRSSELSKLLRNIKIVDSPKLNVFKIEKYPRC